MLSQNDMKKIDRENRAQARMAGRDWSVVLAAVVLIAAIFGFIYFADSTGVPTTSENTLEPAAGTTSAPAYDAGTTSNVSPATPAPTGQYQAE